MRRKLIAAAAVVLVLAVAFAWRVPRMPEYISRYGDQKAKIEVLVSLKRRSSWRSGRLLAVLLRDEDPEVRRTAVATVGALGRADIAPAIGEMARSDANVLVRAQAAAVLADLGDPQAASLAEENLSSPEPDLRIAALQSAARGIPVGEERVVSMLKDPDPRVREAALETAAALRIASAVPILAEDLESEKLFEVTRTHGALKRIANENLGMAKEPWLRWHERNCRPAR